MEENKTIAERAKNIIIEALSIDDTDSVNVYSSLLHDLGAESIDFIDISFQIEKEFGLDRVNGNNIFPFAYFEKDLLDESGKLVSAAVEDIKGKFPHIDDEVFDKIAEKRNKSILFSIYIICKYVEYNTI